MVNYYGHMWPMRSHLLAPLSALTSSTAIWKWTEDEHQKAFDTMKVLIAKETLLTSPDFNKPFEIHTDASKLQLGACISQDGKPLTFYSCKLNPAQTQYTTTKREVLSIVETLKECRHILLGQQILAHTDHENLPFKQVNSDRVMRWRLYIEEYSPDLGYIKGTKNVVADALSRLEKDDLVSKDTKELFYSIIHTFDTEKDNLARHPISYAHLDATPQKRSLDQTTSQS
jgi:hypothetical protein